MRKYGTSNSHSLTRIEFGTESVAYLILAVGSIEILLVISFSELGYSSPCDVCIELLLACLYLRVLLLVLFYHFDTVWHSEEFFFSHQSRYVDVCQCIRVTSSVTLTAVSSFEFRHTGLSSTLVSWHCLGYPYKTSPTWQNVWFLYNALLTSVVSKRAARWGSSTIFCRL